MTATLPLRPGEDLLRYAHLVLDGQLPMPRTRAPRASAVLARRALEDAVDSLCRSAGAHLGRATMRSRLLTLRVLRGDGVADVAEYA